MIFYKQIHRFSLHIRAKIFNKKLCQKRDSSYITFKVFEMDIQNNNINIAVVHAYVHRILRMASQNCTIPLC